MTKKSKIIVALQTFVLAVILVLAFLPGYNRHFEADELVRFMGEYVDGEGAVCSDETTHGHFLKSPDLKLGYGTYQISVKYSSESELNVLQAGLPDVVTGLEDVANRYVTENVPLYSYLNENKTEILVKIPSAKYIATVFYAGQGRLTVESMDIIKTPSGMLRLFIELAIFFAFADFLVICLKKRRNGCIKEENVFMAVCLLGISLFASIPLFLPYLIEGHDLIFHLLRIEGIKEGLLMGEFPVRIQPNWLAGNGYATSVFYGDLLLYIPALIRLCGFTVSEAFIIFVFLVNISTTLIAYLCFVKMTGSKKGALVGTALYTLSMYRLIDIYVRSSVGEYCAMIFLPLLVYSMWLVFSGDIKDPGYKKAYIPGVIALTGIINTHLLTCEIVAVFIIILCLIFVKKVLKKETFFMLAKIALTTLALNVWFILPLADYMHMGGFAVTDGKPIIQSVQIHGTFLGQLLIPFSTSGGLSTGYENGMANEIPVTMGLSLILVGVIALLALFMGRFEDRKEKRVVITGLVFSAVSIYASTYLFPWDGIGRIASIAKKMTLLIQFPFRLLSISMLLLSFVAVVLIKLYKDHKYLKYLGAVLVVISLLQGSRLISDVMNTASPLWLNYGDSLDSNKIIGGEYLPVDSYPIQFGIRYELVPDGVDYICNKRELNRVNCTVTNNTTDEKQIGLSMVYYKGYVARDTATGQKLSVYGKNGVLTIVLPGGYSGTLSVRFEEPVLWKIANAISLLALMVLTVCESGAHKKIIKGIRRNSYNE